MKEADRKLPPTEKQIAYTQILLRQFGCKVDVPEFNTYADMERWRANIIKSR